MENLRKNKTLLTKTRMPSGDETTTPPGRGANAQPRKRARSTRAKDAFSLLTDDALLTPIFEFVGWYEYRFVAILNKRFQRLYSEFQKKRIHPAPKKDYPLLYSAYNKYFSTSLTWTASVAQSIELAKVLESDMKTKGFHQFIEIRKLNKGDARTSCYYVVEQEAISGANQNQSLLFLRDKVAVRYGNLEILQWLCGKGCPLDDESACEVAARQGWMMNQHVK